MNTDSTKIQTITVIDFQDLLDDPNINFGDETPKGSCRASGH